MNDKQANLQENIARQRVRGEQIRAAKAKAKLMRQVAQSTFDAATASYRLQLDQWRKDRVAEIDAQYQQALRAAHPAEAQALEQAVGLAEIELEQAVEQANADYAGWCTGLREGRERAKLEQSWRDLRAEWVAGRSYPTSMKETWESTQYKIERGLMTAEEQAKQMRQQAEMLMHSFADKLEQDGETAYVKQLLGLT